MLRFELESSKQAEAPSPSINPLSQLLNLPSASCPRGRGQYDACVNLLIKECSSTYPLSNEGVGGVGTLKRITLPNITHKQTEILNHIYTHRFLNRIQIQALLNHKDKKNYQLLA